MDVKEAPGNPVEYGDIFPMYPSYCKNSYTQIYKWTHKAVSCLSELEWSLLQQPSEDLRALWPLVASRIRDHEGPVKL